MKSYAQITVSGPMILDVTKEGEVIPYKSLRELVVNKEEEIKNLLKLITREKEELKKMCAERDELLRRVKGYDADIQGMKQSLNIK